MKYIVYWCILNIYCGSASPSKDEFGRLTYITTGDCMIKRDTNCWNNKGFNTWAEAMDFYNKAKALEPDKTVVNQGGFGQYVINVGMDTNK